MTRLFIGISLALLTSALAAPAAGQAPGAPPGLRSEANTGSPSAPCHIDLTGLDSGDRSGSWDRATELPDRALPAADQRGNCIVGAIHAPAPETIERPIAPMVDGMHDWVLANENMARGLAAKSYADQFLVARNAGHVDPAVTARNLPAGLEWVWAGYPARP